MEKRVEVKAGNGGKSSLGVSRVPGAGGGQPGLTGRDLHLCPSGERPLRSALRGDLRTALRLSAGIPVTHSDHKRKVKGESVQAPVLQMKAQVNRQLCPFH